MKSLTIILNLILATSFSMAQDVHFTQYSFNPLSLNPACGGLFDDDFRFAAIYRNQWQTIAVPYNSTAISAEFNQKMKKGNQLSYGINFMYDRAGDSKFSSIYPAINLSYQKFFGKQERLKHALSLGVQPALLVRSFSTAELEFENQYNSTSGVDPSSNNGESFSRFSRSNFDLNAGLAYKLGVLQKHFITLGFSMSHILQPKQSFYNDEEILLNRNYRVNNQMEFYLHPKWNVITDFIFEMQDTKSEYVMGLMGKYKINKTQAKEYALYLGTYYRVNDAAAVMLGFDYNRFHTGITYDVNTSPLKRASNTYGAIEIAMIYTYSYVKKPNETLKICPVY